MWWCSSVKRRYIWSPYCVSDRRSTHRSTLGVLSAVPNRIIVRRGTNTMPLSVRISFTTTVYYHRFRSNAYLPLDRLNISPQGCALRPCGTPPSHVKWEKFIINFLTYSFFSFHLRIATLPFRYRQRTCRKYGCQNHYKVDLGLCRVSFYTRLVRGLYAMPIERIWYRLCV